MCSDASCYAGANCSADCCFDQGSDEGPHSGANQGTCELSESLGGECAFALPNSQPSRLLDARSRMSPMQQPAAPKSRHEYIDRFCISCDADAHQCADGCPQQCTHSSADCEAYCRADDGAHNRPNSSAHQCANGIPDDFAHNRSDAGRRIHRVRADADAAANASPSPPHVLDVER